jgi:hypothetical protein
MYSAFSDVEMLQFNSSQLVPNISRMTLPDICQKGKQIVVLVVYHGIRLTAIGAQVSPQHKFR